MPRPIPRSAFGVDYPSLNAAAQAHGLYAALVIKRMKSGLPLEQALVARFNRHTRGRPVTIQGVEYPSARYASMILGMGSHGPRRLRKYGITLEQYVSQFDAQGGQCATCNTELSLQSRVTVLDHDHRTKQPRGILCQACNLQMAVLDLPEAHLSRLMAYKKNPPWGA